MNIIIIGGGASGLVSAIIAKRNGANVTILEKNKQCGKKLLITGNGRCNFWNEQQDIKFYHSNNIDIFEQFLKANKTKVLSFFDSIGIVSKNKNGYYYPFSNQAVSILNALLTEVHKLKINIIYEEVTNIEKSQNFKITSLKNTYYADKIIIATGSKAYPKTGSDGFGYILAQRLGHSLIPIFPALVQIKGNASYYQNWAGIRCEVKLAYYEKNIYQKEEIGEIQLTDYGISGICAFNLSNQVAKSLTKKQKTEILINFVPWFQGTKNDFKEWLDNQNKKLNKYTLKEILEGFLNHKLVNLLLNLANINEKTTWSQINKDNIVKLIMEFAFIPTEVLSFTNAQVCSGGIPLTEINMKTMESKITKGLYFTGEILDVNGDCGGYNLGFAWMSGIVAGENITKKED